MVSDKDAAFRATTYRVFVPDAPPIDLRIGEVSTRLDAVLARLGCGEWAFVTAWNPEAQPLSAADNAPRQNELLDLLRERGLRWLDGSGIPDRPNWQAEPSVLVLGIERADAVAIGRRFRQVAIVVGKCGGAAELAYCD
jgi:hypothetical protein